jgi:hypothetical protein
MRTHQGPTNEDPDLPTPETPGLKALGAMAAASRRARESGTGPDPVEPARHEGVTPRSTPAQPHQTPRPGAADRRLKTAVWTVAAVVLAASAALVVSLTAGTSTLTPSANTLSPHPAEAPAAGGHGVRNGAAAPPPSRHGTSSTTTTGPTAGPSSTAGGPPVIAGLDPSSGAAGQGIQVSGANFLSSSGEIIATFNGQVAPTSCPAQNSCRVTVPAFNGATSAQVTITTAGGTSNAVTFTYG